MGREQGLLNMKEALRLTVMDDYLGGQLTQAQVAIKLGLSVRQVKRLNQRIREQGTEGLLSKRACRPQSAPSRRSMPRSAGSWRRSRPNTAGCWSPPTTAIAS